ncbi:MAG: hypothetical protein E7L00_04680 [Propionibacteriaceae bacterium]|nr:hypothetical protein [Propionibacteriaceae bacterium]
MSETPNPAVGTAEGERVSGPTEVEYPPPGACYMSHNLPQVPGHSFGDAVAVAESVAGVGPIVAGPPAGARDVLTVGPGVLSVGHRNAVGSGTPSGGGVRGTMSGWSAQSRARMVRTLAELDYTPLLARGIPAMVTLTLPGDWRTVCPDGARFKALVAALRKRWARRWGDLVGVWKLEYQRRGAPHLHIYTVPPFDAAFPGWLSEAWADVVAHPNPAERERHRLAGTGIDYADGIRSRDPRRLAVYFSKHGQYKAKGYQDQPPEGWGNSGRVWGYWGLRKAVVEVELRSERERIELARLLRRHSRYRQRVRVQRGERIDYETGEVTPRYRTVHRRGSRLTGAAGYSVVNDGPALARELARYLKALRQAEERPVS